MFPQGVPKGSTIGPQGVHKGSTKVLQGVHDRSTRDPRGVHKGSTRGPQGVHKGSTVNFQSSSFRHESFDFRVHFRCVSLALRDPRHTEKMKSGAPVQVGDDAGADGAAEATQTGVERRQVGDAGGRRRGHQVTLAEEPHVHHRVVTCAVFFHFNPLDRRHPTCLIVGSQRLCAKRLHCRTIQIT